MATGDTPLTAFNRNLGTNSTFFTNLTVKANKIAKQEGKDMADMMGFILRHRMQLKGSGNGRYPKWDGSDGQKSKESYKHWGVVPYGDYWGLRLKSDAVDGFWYPQLLIKGALSVMAPKGWANAAATGVRKDGTISKLTMGGNRIFSKQMPKGIDPWLKIKRKELKDNIRKAFKNSSKLGVR